MSQLEKLKQGDQSGLKELFDLYYTPLTRYALKFLADPVAAEEIVQDLFVHLWEKKEELTVIGSLQAYLHSAVKNRALNHLKSKIRKIQQASQETETIQNLGYSESNGLEEQELKALLESTLSQLPVKTASIFKMSRQGDMSYAEIALEIGISKKAVEYHISSALKVIRQVLKKYGYLIAVVLFF